MRVIVFAWTMSPGLCRSVEKSDDKQRATAIGYRCVEYQYGNPFAVVFTDNRQNWTENTDLVGTATF